MKKNIILLNAIMSLIQIILVAGILFFLYRFLLKTIGVDQLGIWSLVLATTSVTQIANFGFSGSVVKFVAKYAAREDERSVSGVIQTAALSLALMMGTFILIGYPVIKWVLSLVVPSNSLAYAISILPYALVSLWLTTITGVFQSGLDGFQRIYIRNFIVMGGSLFFAILCFIFARKYGLIGLAYAQIINNAMILILSWILIKRLLPVLPVIPYQWDKSLFKEIVGYGINFQIISISNMLYDPITKAFLSKFGGLSMVGYYEMANKMVQQFRSLIVSSNQVLVPAIADLQENNPERIRSIYLTNYNLLFFLALPLYTLIIISTPFISEIWIGHYEKVFISIGIFLAIGNFLNTLNVPAYFSNLGIGSLKWNVIGHIAIAVLNIIFSAFLGFLFGGYGVVIGWALALSLGSAVIYISYHIDNKIPVSELFPKDSRGMFIVCFIVLVLSLIMQSSIIIDIKSILMNIVVIFFSTLIIFIPLWFHPMRYRIIGWSKELIRSKMV